MAQKKDTCDIEGCENPSKRTLAVEKNLKYVEAVGLKLQIPKKARKFHICHEHYKKIKKLIKKDRDIERLRF